MQPKRAIILAAGCGTRLGPLAEGIPKCLLTIGTRSLLERSLRALENFSPFEVCLVAGYSSQSLLRFLETFATSLNLHVCFNPDYAVTNNAHSLGISLCRHEKEPFLLLDGDLLFEARLLEKLMEDPRENLLVVERGRGQIDEEAMKVVLHRTDQAIKRIGKWIPREEAYGEFIGMAKFSSLWVSKLYDQLQGLTPASTLSRAYYEDIIQNVLPIAPPLGVLPANGFSWAEIDTAEDFQTVTSRWER